MSSGNSLKVETSGQDFPEVISLNHKLPNGKVPVTARGGTSLSWRIHQREIVSTPKYIQNWPQLYNPQNNNNNQFDLLVSRSKAAGAGLLAGSPVLGLEPEGVGHRPPVAARARQTDRLQREMLDLTTKTV